MPKIIITGSPNTINQNVSVNGKVTEIPVGSEQEVSDEVLEALEASSVTFDLVGAKGGRRSGGRDNTSQVPAPKTPDPGSPEAKTAAKSTRPKRKRATSKKGAAKEAPAPEAKEAATKE